MLRGFNCTNAGWSISHVLSSKQANQSLVRQDSPSLLISAKIQRTSGCQGPPILGVQRPNLCKKSSFQGSKPGSKQQTTNLPNRALLWQAGSTSPRPPRDVGRVIMDQATLALVGEPSPPDHRKFLINRYT